MKYLKKYKLFESQEHKYKCERCGWSWDLSDGGKDPFTCHKCGFTSEKMEWSKYFEIISFKYGFFEGDYRIIDKSHPEFIDCLLDCVESSFDSEKDDVSIYSVKRLSDEEVFTIGDEVIVFGIDQGSKLDGLGGITNIFTSLSQMRADFGRIGIVLNHEDIKSKQKGE